MLFVVMVSVEPAGTVSTPARSSVPVVVTLFTIAKFQKGWIFVVVFAVRSAAFAPLKITELVPELNAGPTTENVQLPATEIVDPPALKAAEPITTSPLTVTDEEFALNVPELSVIDPATVIVDVRAL